MGIDLPAIGSAQERYQGRRRTDRGVHPLEEEVVGKNRTRVSSKGGEVPLGTVEEMSVACGGLGLVKELGQFSNLSFHD